MRKQNKMKIEKEGTINEKCARGSEEKDREGWKIREGNLKELNFTCFCVLLQNSRNKDLRT